MPFKQIDTALQGYVDVPARHGGSRRPPGPGRRRRRRRSRRPHRRRSSDVPDLQEIIALPQDEMTRGRRSASSARAAAAAAAAPRTAPAAAARASTTSTGSTALKTLDFDSSEPQRAGRLPLHQEGVRSGRSPGIDFVPEANPPRKTDNSGIPGAARGRDGLILDLADEMIPYTPEELIALANKEFAWYEDEMKKASRQMGFGDDWKKALEKVKGMHVAPGAQPAADPRPAVRGGRLPAGEGPDHGAAGRERVAADVDDVAGAAARRTPSSSAARRSSSRTRPTRWSTTRGCRACAATTSRSRTPSRHHEMIPGHNLVGFIGAALRRLPRPHRRQHAVLRRGLAALLGADPLRQGLPRHARGAGRRALLAHAPLRAHHLLAEVPHWAVVAAGVHRLPGRQGRPRARQRHGRSAALVPGRLRSALPGRVPARRPPAARAAQGAGRLTADDRESTSTTRSCARAACRSRWCAWR